MRFINTAVGSPTACSSFFFRTTPLVPRDWRRASAALSAESSANGIEVPIFSASISFLVLIGPVPGVTTGLSSSSSYDDPTPDDDAPDELGSEGTASLDSPFPFFDIYNAIIKYSTIYVVQKKYNTHAMWYI